MVTVNSKEANHYNFSIQQFIKACYYFIISLLIYEKNIIFNNQVN